MGGLQGKRYDLGRAYAARGDLGEIGRGEDIAVVLQVVLAVGGLLQQHAVDLGRGQDQRSEDEGHHQALGTLPGVLLAAPFPQGIERRRPGDEEEEGYEPDVHEGDEGFEALAQLAVLHVEVAEIEDAGTVEVDEQEHREHTQPVQFVAPGIGRIAYHQPLLPLQSYGSIAW